MTAIPDNRRASNVDRRVLDALGERVQSVAAMTGPADLGTGRPKQRAGVVTRG